MLIAAFANAAIAEQPASLDSLLEPIRATNGLPALAAAVAHDGKTVALGAVGFRKDGSPERVTLDDKWHIGSCTKSMTAVLAAMLIEEGKFRWDTTLAEMFPQLAPRMQEGWRGVTLEQLLTHHGGAPHDLDEGGLWGRLWERVSLPPLEQREYLTEELLTKEKPVVRPRTKFIYANAGYALVGHAIETKLNRPWEDVLRERLFKPLGMASAGFGTPATPGHVDQPWGHVVDKSGKLTPIAPGLGADNPAAIGPAGTVHCSIGDLATYAIFQVRGERHGGGLLKPETFRRLHTPAGPEGDYACGWIVTSRPWGGGRVLTHSGSNLANITVFWLAPKRDFAVVVCTNLGGERAKKATDDAAGALVQRFLLRK